MTVTDMDPTGRYAVGWYRPNHLSAAEGADVLVRWDNGVPHPLPVSGLDAYAAGVNSAGVVAGYVGHAQTDQSAWVYADGQVTTLPLPAGYSSAAAIAINGRGEVVGNAYKDSGDLSVVVWSVDGSRAPRLLEPRGASAFDIADDGTVVGILAGPVRPYAWDPDGVGRVLPVPAGAQQAIPATVRGEWAAGGAQERSGAAMALRWNLRTGEVSVVGGREPAFASAVNSRGDVALPSASDTGGFPQLVRDGVATELPRLPPRPGESAGLGELRMAVVALSDDGTVAAGNQSTIVIDPSSNQGRVEGQRAVLWRC